MVTKKLDECPVLDLCGAGAAGKQQGGKQQCQPFVFHGISFPGVARWVVLRVCFGLIFSFVVLFVESGRWRMTLLPFVTIFSGRFLILCVLQLRSTGLPESWGDNPGSISCST